MMTIDAGVESTYCKQRLGKRDGLPVGRGGGRSTWRRVASGAGDRALYKRDWPTVQLWQRLRGHTRAQAARPDPIAQDHTVTVENAVR